MSVEALDKQVDIATLIESDFLYLSRLSQSLKGLFLAEIGYLILFLGEVDDVSGLSFNIGGYGVLNLSSACCDPLGCKMVVYRSDPN